MSTHAESDLFQSVKLGPYTLANRIVMAPLTRSRANKDDAPYELHSLFNTKGNRHRAFVSISLGLFAQWVSGFCRFRDYSS